MPWGGGPAKAVSSLGWLIGDNKGEEEKDLVAGSLCRSTLSGRMVQEVGESLLSLDVLESACSSRSSSGCRSGMRSDLVRSSRKRGDARVEIVGDRVVLMLALVSV